MNELGKIFTKNGADKATKHKYHDIYEPIFAPNRDKKINFLEIGIWKGHGMQSFLDYFPNGQIYGLDIFTRMSPDDVPALQNPRAHWAKVDTTTSKTSSILSTKFGVEYDYILDDGAHHPEANLLTFRNCIPYLKSGGIYIIEDVWPIERMNPKQLSHDWIKRHRDKYNSFTNEKFLIELESSGMKIERFDNRQKTGNPDSYVITLRKE